MTLPSDLPDPDPPRTVFPPSTPFPLDLIDLIGSWRLPSESLFDTVSRILLDQALSRAGGSQKIAASLLGVSARMMNYRMGRLRMRPIDEERRG